MSVTATREDKIIKLGELIKDIDFAMLSTQESDATLRSRAMPTQKAALDGTLRLFTAANTPKVEEIERDHQVNLSYAKPGNQSFVSISGTARLVRDKQKMEELWNPILKAWFPQGLEDPQLALLKVTVEQAEYWDSPDS